MKRKGGKTNEQPAKKKSDGNVSTDLRSKIGAKLQTLLNGITSDSDMFIRSRRELYADLFREPQYPEIVIDPTVVVKIEDNDSEQSSDAVAQLPPEDFLSSAKSRLTELLNKRQDSEKENSISSTECIPSSSSKSRTSQSLSSNSSRGRTRNSSNSESSNTSHSDVLISQGQLQNVCVIVEDIMKSNNQAQSTYLLPDQSKKSHSSSTSSQILCPKNKKNLLDKCGKTNTKDSQTIIIDETVTNCECSSEVDLCSDDTEDVANSSQSHASSSVYFKKQSCSKYKNAPNLRSSENSKRSMRDTSPEVLNLCDTLIQNNSSNLDIYDAEYGSEIIDDPEVILTVGESIEPDSNSDIVSNSSIHDPDIVVLCEKKPAYEVITLEEDNDSGDIIEEFQKCFQCGKTFRAKSLLNFHLRMHGNDTVLSQASSSSAQSCSISLRRP